MEKIIAYIMKKHIALIAVLLILGAVPFFWFKPGEINIGGDSSRLYFYDPVNYLKNLALYSIVPGLTGYESVNYFFTPFVTLFIVLKKMFVSPAIVTDIFHGFMLVTSFLFTYVSIAELLRRNTANRTFIFFAGCVGGLFYIFGPTVGNWDKAITSHNQIFLNPLIFFLLLKYALSDNPFYLTVILLISFVFSVNFSYVAAPPLFSFYPFILFYLFVYKKYIVQTPIRWKTIAVFTFLFFSIQAFHLVPQFYVIFNKTSYEFKHVFTAEGVSYGLNFFNATYQGIKLSKNLALIPQTNRSLTVLEYLLFIFPVIIVLGLMVQSSNKSSVRQRLSHLLLMPIFLVVLFFDTANITNIGLSFYQLLFKLPGFAMFRNFYGQFSYVTSFYFALVLGLSLYAILTIATKKIRMLLYVTLPMILILNGWPLINGHMVKLPILGSKDVTVPQRFDPNFEKTLEYIRQIPTDSKFLTLPLTDFGYQMLAGTNGGLYIGPSMIGYLAGKKDFMGYATFEPFREVLFDRIKHKDYKNVQFILSLFNIRYIFYNSDSFIYDKFPGFPYDNVRKYFPDQKSFRDFISHLDVTSEHQISDKYHIYELSRPLYLPSIYVAGETMYWDTLSMDLVLGDFPITDNRLAIYSEVRDVAVNPDIETLYLKPENNSQYLDLFKHRKAQIAAPYISRRLSWFLYPLIALKEENDFRSYRSADDAFIDRSIFYAEKRIGELDTWKDEIPLKGNVQSIKELDRQWKEPDLLNFSRFKEYNTWEISLVRYRRIIQDLLLKLEKNNASKSSLLTVKTDLKGIFAHQHERLITIVNDSHKGEEEKIYLWNLIDHMYEEIQSQLQYTFPSATHVSYGIHGSPVNDVFEVLLDKEGVSDYTRSDFELLFSGRKLTPQPDIGDNVLHFGEISLSTQSAEPITLNVLRPVNLAEKVQWLSPGFINGNQQGNVSLSIEDSGSGNLSGMTTNITSWQPESYYFISFDYRTFGHTFTIQASEKDGSIDSVARQILNDTLKSSDWNKYQTIVVSGEKVQTAHINVSYDTERKEIEYINHGLKPTIEIKNVFIFRIPNPNIILRKKIEKTEREKILPAIEFQKINPTRYTVKITNAKEPFTLVFSQAYSSNWKLVDMEKSTKGIRGWFVRQLAKVFQYVTKPFTESVSNALAEQYYGGSIREKVEQNVFLSKQTFGTWGKDTVADDRHAMVNGYANGWYIKPQDLHNRDSYELVIEMASQKIFYGSLAISLVTFSGVIILGIFYFKSKHGRHSHF